VVLGWEKAGGRGEGGRESEVYISRFGLGFVDTWEVEIDSKVKEGRIEHLIW